MYQQVLFYVWRTVQFMVALLLSLVLLLPFSLKDMQISKLSKILMEYVQFMKNISTVRQYMDTNFHLTFFNYLLVALPASALMLILCWIWLQIRYGLIEWSICKKRSSNQLNEHLKRILKRQYNELGSIRQVYSFLNK